MIRLGITIGLEPDSPTEAVELAEAAEGLGYTDAWSAEVAGVDGLVALAPVAARTNALRLGTAILPVFTRPPALLAMGAATLQSVAGGRFVLGLGTSSSIIVERWMGTSFERPLTRLREYVEVLREILSGKKVSYEGQTTSVDGFRLLLDTGTDVPIYVAALGEKACRLAGEVADGVIFFLKTPRGVAQAMSWVAEGARAAGRDPETLDSVIRVPTALDEDEDVFRFMARRLVTTYAAVDVYNNSLSRQGYADEAAGIARAWSAGNRDKANEYVTDELLDDLFISGTRDECLTKLQSFRDAGVKTPVLSPVSVAGDPVERKERVGLTLERLAPA